MKETPIIWFDGTCLLCNRSVQFILRHDPDGFFRFGLLEDFTSDLPARLPNSIILEMHQQTYTESTAVLNILKHLNTPFRYAYILRWIPRPVRDFFYRIVAKNRYRWFGKGETCLLMQGEYRDRFIRKSS
jgi:predicted DCC family thiol-disulfide oxidoreductase YuxK